MLGSDVFMVEPLGLLGAMRKHALALMAQRQLDRGRHFFAQGGMRFDLLADRFHGRAGVEETVGQRLILPQQPQQQMFGLDARAAGLTRLKTGEKDPPAGLFGITFKHDSCPRLENRQKKDRMKAQLESACRAKFKLCVTWFEVRRRDRCRSSRRPMIISPVRKSRLPVGSSARRALESPTSAREDPRCCYPPDNCPCGATRDFVIRLHPTSPSIRAPRLLCCPPDLLGHRSGVSVASQHRLRPVRFQSIYPFSSFRRRCFGGPGCWDVFKALALGARAVGVGRPFLWGLGTFGQGPRAISKDPNLLVERILARALLLSEGYRRPAAFCWAFFCRRGRRCLFFESFWPFFKNFAGG